MGAGSYHKKKDKTAKGMFGDMMKMKGGKKGKKGKRKAFGKKKGSSKAYK